MAQKQDLMGLGLPAPLARRLATQPVTVTGVGATRASAFQIAGDAYLISITSSNSGTGTVLPTVGGDPAAGAGALLGDDFIINCQIVGGCTLYGPTGTSISMNGANASGSGAVTLNSHTTTTFYPITSTSWLGVQGS